jgi:hypothetical protein
MIDTTTHDPHAPEAEELIDADYPRFSPQMIEHVRPRVLSRWVATIASFDRDVTYRDIDRVYGIEQPAVVRMPSHVGPAYASSCVGVRISCYAQASGLRSGQVELVHPDGRSELLAPRVGFIEQAVATEHGVTAVLAILSGQLHEDLGRLDERGQLASAQICMLQKTRAIRYVTDWGLSVYVVDYVRARLCQLTSLSHVPGNYVQRRLALDESLGEDDLQPTALRWTPAAFASDVVGERPMVAVINPGQVTPPIRSAWGAQNFAYTLSAGAKATPTQVTYNLTKVPECTFDSGDTGGDVAVWLAGVSSTSLYMCGRNHGSSPVSGVATLYFW